MDEHTQNNSHNAFINLLLEDGLQDALPKIAELLMNTAMLLERERHIGAAPHQRNVERNGYANGFKPRTFQTALGSLDLAIAIATMYVQGVSTRKVTKVMEQLCGFEVSSGQVSNLNKQLDEEFEKWRNRPLPEILYLTVDATYYKVRIDGVVRDCATLIASGVRRSDGKRIILGVSCALSEAEVHWREFLTSLKERGIGMVDYIVSDAHTGLRAALKATFNASIWQRCQFHLQKNAQEYVTKQHLKSNVAADIKIIFNADNQAHAEERLRAFIESYRESQPKLVEWAESNLPEGFTVFALPECHRKKMRTSNACETLNSQIKRRTRVVGLFPNEDSLLRLVTAVLIEISDGWETGKAYLKLI